MRFVLIDSDITDIPSIVSAFTADVHYYVFDWNVDTISVLKEKLTQDYDSVGIIQHNKYTSTYNILSNATNALVTNVEIEDPDLLTWTEFIEFLQWMYTNSNITAVDLFACELWIDDNWKYIIQTIQDKYNIHIRASINITGEGGDFILESDNFNTIGVYFTEDILQYRYAFLTVPFAPTIDAVNTKSTSSGTITVSFTDTSNSLNNEVGYQYSVGNVSRAVNTDISLNVAVALGTVSNQNTSLAITGPGSTRLIIIGSFKDTRGGLSYMRFSSGAWGGVTQAKRTFDVSPPTQTDFTGCSITSDATRLVVTVGQNGVSAYVYWANASGLYTTDASLSFTRIDDTTLRAYRGVSVTPDGSRLVVAVSTVSFGRIYYSDWNGTNYGPLNAILDSRMQSYHSTYISPDKSKILFAGSTASWALWNGSNYQTMGDLSLITNSSIASIAVFGYGTLYEFVTFITYANSNSAYATWNGNGYNTFTTISSTLIPTIAYTAAVADSEFIHYVGINTTSLRRIRVTPTLRTIYGSYIDSNVLFDGRSGPYSLIASDLSSNVPYIIKVRAINTDGSSNDVFTSQLPVFGSVPVISSVSPVLGAPMNLRVVYSQTPFKGTIPVTYYYSRNADGSNRTAATDSSFVITDASQTTTFYVIAENSAGNLISEGVSGTPYLLGDKPTIDSITPSVGNSVTVNFTQSNVGNGNPIYYYGFQGSGVRTDASAVSSPLVIRNLTNTTPYSIYLVARNEVGDISSNSYSGIIVLGSKPVITGITKNIGNSVTVAFTQSQKGTNTTIYYYSLDGTNVLLDASSSGTSLTIPNLTSQTEYNISIIARNPAGDVFSDASSNIAILGSNPVITGITKSIGNSVTVEFTQSQKGTDTTVYYYSLNGSTVLLDASSSGTSLTIPNLTNTTAYNISIVARNPAGDVLSDASSNITILGSKPVITGITKNIGNSVTVAFTQPQKGTNTTVYYYSLDGTNVLLDASSSGTSLTIPNLTAQTEYNISIIARNPAGDVFSDASSNITVLGSRPVITGITKTIGNSVTVEFTQYQKGTDPTIYYYSLDGTNVLLDAFSSGTSLTIPNLTNTTAYNISIVARNPAGDVFSVDSSNITVLGSNPVITGITKTIGNSVTVEFTQSQKGTDPTIYHYSLDGTNVLLDASSSGTSLTIPNLTAQTEYNISIVARNLAGDVFSDASSNITILGTTPTLTAVPVLYSDKVIRLTHAQTSTGTTPVTYYYTTDNSANTTTKTAFPVDSSTVDISNVLATTTYYVIASNDAGNVISLGVSGTPYLLGSNPTLITSPVANADKVVRLTYTQTSQGTTPVTYYYTTDNSANTTTKTAFPVDSSTVDVSNVLATTTFYVIAENSAGNLISEGVSGTPYLLGSNPTIDSVTSNIENQVTISFTQTNVGNGTPVYYYGFQGSGVRTDASAVSSPLVITGLTNTTPYSIYLVARNEAGDISSNSYSGINVFGSNPVITGITKNIGNSVTVAFTQSQKGTDSTIYYYSLDGTNVSLDASATTSPIIIPGLTNDTSYNISIVANNPAGNVFSDASTGITILGEQISLTAAAVENVDKTIRLTYAQTNKGTLPVTYYYTTVNNVNTTTRTAFPVDSSTVDISNVSETTTYYAISSNSAGNIISTGATVTPNTLGDIPTISAVPVLNSPGVVRLEYLQGSAGNAVTTYFYSTSSNKDTTSKTIFSTNPIDVSGVTELTTYYVIASSSAGNIISSGTSVTPYLLGSKPTISDIVPSVGNSLTVAFTQTNPGIDTPIYYYSFDGSSVSLDASATVSPLVITGLTNTTPPYTIYLVAKNNAGNVFSDAFSGVNILGTTPTIGTITKNIGNSVTVSFAQLQKGTDTTVYYGSTDGFTAILDASSSSSTEPLTIRNLNNASPYNIYVIARNPAGDVPSIVSSGIDMFGTTPVINTITRNIGNSVTINFTQSQKGTDSTVYYGSIDGNSIIEDASSSSSNGSLTIQNLNNVSPYNFYVIARNPAGDVISDSSSGIHILGTKPVITSITRNIGNSVTVAFDQSQKGTGTTIYYGSIDGSSVLLDASSSGTSLTIPNLTDIFAYNISIIARNPAGDVVSDSSSGIHILGTNPTITSITRNIGNSVTVDFTQSQKGTGTTVYYGSIDGTNAILDASSSGTSLTIPNLTDVSAYNISIIARNPAGDVVSDSSSGIHILGTNPTITSITRNIGNSVTVDFTQSQKGTDTTVYYGSIDGSSVLLDASSSGTSLTIPNLTDVSAYNISIIARNPAGDVVSDSSSGIHILGTNPTITSITRNIGNSVTVAFAQSQKGTDSTVYYGSIDGSSVLLDASSSGTSLTIPNLTDVSTYSISIIARNPAGDVISDSSSGIHVLGTTPVITNITRNIGNSVTVAFAQYQKGTDSTIYYGSIDGTNAILDASSSGTSLTIPNLTDVSAYNISIIARNPAGDVVSDSSSGIHILGTNPTITSITRNIGNSVTVAFTQSQKGTDSTVYYGSIDGTNAILDASSSGTSLTIPNLTDVSAYNISIIARNPAGDVISDSSSGIHVLGTTPVITSITRNIGNSVTVAFAQSQKGTGTTIYYGSIDGSSVLLDASSSGTSLTIPNLTDVSAYSISIIARNPAGDVVSDSSSGIHILGTNPTITSITRNIGNSVTVAFDQSQKGTGTTVYYGSIDGSSVLLDASSSGTSLTISNLTDVSAYNISIIARNPAGDVVSVPSSGIHVLGTKPTITSITRNVGNSVTVAFAQSQKGTDATVYYGSIDGTNAILDASSSGTSLTIPNLTDVSAYSISIIARNPAGDVVSDSSSGIHVLGIKPTITSIARNIGNSVTVDFTQSQKGTGTTIYYGSIDGTNAILDASSSGTSLTIPNLTDVSAYSIYIIARNPAGDVISDSSSGIHVLGTNPTITSITRNIGNSVTVAFAQSQKGTDTTIYYGSIDGINAILDASSSGTSLTIPNLTDVSAYSISIIARNPAGDVVSDSSSGIHILGTKPTITSINRNIGNSVTVAFTQSQKGTGSTVYYGSINGTNAILDASSSGTSLTIPNLTDVSGYNISIIARNPAGDVVSDPSLNVSILGTQPSFSLVSQTNNLRGTITQTQKGTLPVSYYYSSDGINKDFEVSFPTFDISGTISRTFYIIVDNSAGQVVSSPVSGTPFIFGTMPSISSVVPGSQTLTVNFSQDQTGTTPVKYYYSYDPSGTTRIAEVNTPSFNISGTQPRTVYIVVDNSAGTLVSAGVSGTPYIFGTTPLITLIQRGSQKITVTFTQSSKGTEPVKYYYSFDRVNRISEVTTNTFDILYEVDSRIGNKTYNVDVSGGLYSFTGEVTGTNPNITVVKGSMLTFNVNSPGHPLWIKTSNITGTDSAVTTDISNNGTQSGTIEWNTSNIATGTYYYICQYHSSMVGSITIIPPENNPLTTAKNVSIIADNSAGTLVSDDVSGTPYTFGSVPVIQSVTPGPNRLTVLFSQDTLGNTPSTYSYSFDASGTNPTAIDSSSTFIVNGSQPRTIYLIATNLAGSLISPGFLGTPFVVGDTPSIDDVVAGPYSLTVKFSQTNAGNTPVTYYYSYSADGSNPEGPVFLPEFTVTASTTTTIYVVADSSSGYLVSAGFTKTPFVFGNNPVINDPIIPGTETLTVSFTQSPKGTEPVTYYYSFLSDGSGRIGPVTSPFTISTTTTRTVYVVASNLAGNLVSSGKTSTPYTFANKPVITDIVPSSYNLKVYFTPSTTGTTPITYYYSEFANGSNPVGPVTSPFDISGSVERTIYIVADNSAGNVVSTGFTQTPYIFGTVPSIDSIVPGPNKMTVSFTSSVGGTEPVYHYYSYDQSGSNGILATSPFVITGTSTRTVYIVANNIVGNLVSTGVSGTPFVVGGIPIIESVISQTNNLRVTFSHPEPGNTAVTYYYSDDASGNNLIEQVDLPTFDISGTITRTIYVVSINSAGKLVSEPVTATPFIFGTVPVIESVTPGTERLSVKFSQAQTGSTPVNYYYSFLSDGSNAIGPIDTSFNFTETLPRTIYIVARNAAGNLVSAGISGTPFVYGNKPIITGLQPGLNKLTVSFTQTIQGTTPVRYYYSEFANGSTRVGPVTSPFDISNIDTLKTVYIVADNSAGIVVSDASSATPYVLGTNPVVSAIVPGTNKLTVSFSQSSKGTEPVTYYYSEFSNGTSRVGPVTSPFDISNILVSKTVYIIAENPGGTLISLSEASGTPYIFGSTPSITTVQPGTNSLIVNFNPSSGGTTPVTNYYSYSSSGIPRVAQIQSGASTFTISNIFESKTVYIVSENPAGTLVSSGVSETPYILGDLPVISTITPGTNKLVVNFSQSNKGTLPVTYYYSFNGSTRLGTVTTPSFEIATTVERTVYIIADNSAGTLVSSGVSGTPYIFGSALNVTLSSPVSNTIRVSYNQATQGTTPTTYKYVLNGGSSVVASTNPNGIFDISGLTSTSPYSVYMIASNAAGDLSSNTLTQPVLGTQPTISSVTPGTNKLVVNFSQSNKGTLPVTYYYSFNGTARLGTVTTPSFEIATTVERTVYIIADNSAGTLVSSDVSGIPYIFGSALNVTLSSPVSNTIRVSYSQATQGTTPTTYKYVLNNSSSVVVSTNPNGIFDISGLTSTSPYSVYMIASNAAGDLSSNTLTQPVLGTQPTISSVTPGTNKLVVNFDQSNKGTLPVTYYYSFNGSARLGTVTTPSFEIATTVERTVYIIADNSAGTLVSSGVSRTPYIVGTPPTVSIESGVNEITVYFSNTGGTSPVTYYYSYESNGSNPIGPVTSPFNISDITTANTIYIVASNIAGTIISNAATGIPYVVGSAPVINSISSGIRSLIVDFSGSTGGVPSPYAYYYSLDEGTYTLASSLTSPITIEGLMIEKQYTVKLIAQNSAGFTLPSNLEVGFPIYKQPIFNIVNASPPKDANADSGGSFAQNKNTFLKTYSPPPTTIENQQLQLKKNIIGGGRRSADDVIRKKRVEAVGSSFNAASGDFSINETSTNVTRKMRIRR